MQRGGTFDGDRLKAVGVQCSVSTRCPPERGLVGVLTEASLGVYS